MGIIIDSKDYRTVRLEVGEMIAHSIILGQIVDFSISWIGPCKEPPVSVKESISDRERR